MLYFTHSFSIIEYSEDFKIFDLKQWNVTSFLLFMIVYSCVDMSQACIKHCRNSMNLAAENWNFASITENIFVFRCKEVTELLSCVMILKEFLKTHDQVDVWYYTLKLSIYS